MQRELILNFHGVGSPHRRVETQEHAVWISRESFTELLDCVVELKTTEVPTAITFDDGNSSDLTIALPELTARRLTAAFFVCAGRLENPDYLNGEALRQLLRAGMTVGSHGMNHRDWRNLDEAELSEEIVTARKRLEDVCGVPVTTAAIPFGSYNRRVLTKLRAEQYSSVYSSDRGLARSQAWLKPRNTLGARATPEHITRVLHNRVSLESMFRSARGIYRRLR